MALQMLRCKKRWVMWVMAVLCSISLYSMQDSGYESDLEEDMGEVFGGLGDKVSSLHIACKIKDKNADQIRHDLVQFISQKKESLLDKSRIRKPFLVMLIPFFTDNAFISEEENYQQTKDTISHVSAYEKLSPEEKAKIRKEILINSEGFVEVGKVTDSYGYLPLRESFGKFQTLAMKHQQNKKHDDTPKELLVAPTAPCIARLLAHNKNDFSIQQRRLERENKSKERLAFLKQKEKEAAEEIRRSNWKRAQLKINERNRYLPLLEDSKISQQTIAYEEFRKNIRAYNGQRFVPRPLPANKALPEKQKNFLSQIWSIFR